MGSRDLGASAAGAAIQPARVVPTDADGTIP